jgi:intracellular sulfur oxidation DsrE/DsrF family protein
MKSGDDGPMGLRAVAADGGLSACSAPKSTTARQAQALDCTGFSLSACRQTVKSAALQHDFMGFLDH